MKAVLGCPRWSQMLNDGDAANHLPFCSGHILPGSFPPCVSKCSHERATVSCCFLAKKTEAQDPCGKGIFLSGGGLTAENGHSRGGSHLQQGQRRAVTQSTALHVLGGFWGRKGKENVCTGTEVGEPPTSDIHSNHPTGACRGGTPAAPAARAQRRDGLQAGPRCLQHRGRCPGSVLLHLPSACTEIHGSDGWSLDITTKAQHHRQARDCHHAAGECVTSEGMGLQGMGREEALLGSFQPVGKSRRSLLQTGSKLSCLLHCSSGSMYK